MGSNTGLLEQSYFVAEMAAISDENLFIQIQKSTYTVNNRIIDFGSTNYYANVSVHSNKEIELTWFNGHKQILKPCSYAPQKDLGARPIFTELEINNTCGPLINPDIPFCDLSRFSK